MIKWPKEVVEELARRRCVLFLGSGISANSINSVGTHPKTWGLFLKEGMNRLTKRSHKELVRKHINYRNYLTACELLRRFMGQDDFVRFIKDEFQTPNFMPAEIHKSIFNLDTRIVVTPNFDKIYDGYATQETNGGVVVKYYYEPDLVRSLRDSQRLILKIHGTIDSADRLIFTQADYAKARVEYANFYQLLNALLITHSFVFLGAGLDDPDIKLLLENYAHQFQYTRKHYFVIPKEDYNTNELSVYEDVYKLNFIKYSNVDNHKEFKDSIAQLVTLVSSERDVMASNLSW